MLNEQLARTSLEQDQQHTTTFQKNVDRRKMTVISQMCDYTSLNHSLNYAGLAKSAWYHKSKPRYIGMNRDVLQAVQKTGHKRPTCGTRRIAAQLSGNWRVL